MSHWRHPRPPGDNTNKRRVNWQLWKPRHTYMHASVHIHTVQYNTVHYIVQQNSTEQTDRQTYTHTQTRAQHTHAHTQEHLTQVYPCRTHLHTHKIHTYQIHTNRQTYIPACTCPNLQPLQPEKSFSLESHCSRSLRLWLEVPVAGLIFDLLLP